MAKAADLAQFQVNVETPRGGRRRTRKTGSASGTRLITKGFRVKPEAARQFDMLKAEVAGQTARIKGRVDC